MKIDPAREAILQRVRVAKAALVNAKRDAHIRARLIVEDEVASYTASLEHEVRQAFEAGIPKRRIRLEGLGTSDAKTLDDMLRHTKAAYEALAANLAADPLCERYSLDSDARELRVTLDGADLTAALYECDYPTDDPAFVAKHELASATLKVNTREDGSLYLTSVTELWIPELANSHPVVAWAQQPANEAEALAWYKAKVAA